MFRTLSALLLKNSSLDTHSTAACGTADTKNQALRRNTPFLWKVLHLVLSFFLEKKEKKKVFLLFLQRVRRFLHPTGVIKPWHHPQESVFVAFCNSNTLIPKFLTRP
jgi:hypothetical protein